MAKKFGFFNSINGDRKYLATDISQAFDVAVSTGLQAIPDSFKIVPNDGMTVKMLPGGCMIYGAFCVDNEDEIIELDVADGELNRIDRIVVRYDRFERSIKTVVIKGTPALNPTAPTPLRNENQFDLVLADIRVNKTVTSITASDITDMRYSELCGFIGVKGAVTEERFESHLAESVAQVVSVTRDISLTGNQRIALPFKPKAVICTAFIHGSAGPGLVFSDAIWTQGITRAKSITLSGNIYSRNSLIYLTVSSGNDIIGDITNVTETGFDIAWSKNGSPTGTVTLQILAIGHGRDEQ